MKHFIEYPAWPEVYVGLVETNMNRRYVCSFVTDLCFFISFFVGG